MLLSIINQGIDSLEETEVDTIELKQIIDNKYQYSFGDFLYRFRKWFSLLIVCIFVLFGGYQFYVSRRKKGKQDLAMKNRQLKDAMIQANHANSAKGQFLASMSHEIRTPLNSIMGITKLAKVSLQDEEKVSKYLDEIESSSKILLGIVNNILDMSAIEHNRIQIQKEPFVMLDVLHSIQSVYLPQCRQKGIEFVLREENINHLRLIGDEFRLSQVLLNLLSNSFKFTPAGGTITLTVEEKSKQGRKVFFQFLIQDTGVGMSKELLDRLILPTDSHGVAVAKKYEESGLGLALTRNLLDLMQAEMSVESTKGVGMTYTVSIPFETENIQEPTEVEETEEFVDYVKNYDFSGYRMLLAEDTALSAEVAIDLLELVNMEVDHVEDGEKAVQKFMESQPGTYLGILMDIQMPKMDGLEATRRIRQLDHLEAKTIPIYALSANAYDEDVSAAINAGMNGHMSKPVDTLVLYNQIETLINGKE